MTDPDNTSRPIPSEDDEALRQRLVKRAALAGVAVLALVGGLFLFDALYVSPSPQVAVAPEPSPVAEQAQDQLAEPAAETVAEEGKTLEPTTEATGEAGEAPPAPVAASQPEVAAEPEVSAAPTGTLPQEKTERPPTAPARARMAHMRPTPLPVPVKPEPVRELSEAPTPASQPPASRPIARAAAGSGHFLVQMGVFNNMVNAEELRAKLELAGVPTQIEARVQVGPFATRQEAEQAREKLKELGLETGLVVAVRK